MNIEENNYTFDINAVTADFLIEEIKSTQGKLLDRLKRIHEFINSKLRIGYNKYIAKIAEQYISTKSFFCCAHPVYLYDFFVIPNLKVKGEIIPININNLIRNRNIPCISGSAGCGKSILMKHLFVQLCIKTNKLPIFFELREINPAILDFFELIKEKLSNNSVDISYENIKKMLSHGDFIIFLDGFDELNQEYRSNLLKQLVLVKNNSLDIDIIISSRHDDLLFSNNNIAIFDIAPFNIDQACTLIRKIPYDDDSLKNQFIKDLENGLFEKHKSFLSNPLLLTIMLMTYGEHAHIPSKITTFYDQAYSALFSQHDARKSAFKRIRKTTLDINDFAEAFAAFCFLSLRQEEISFSEVSANFLIKKSQELTAIPIKSEDFLDDLIKSVCLLIKDGLVITFTHRSFQEYFTALFIKNLKNQEAQKKLIYHFSQSHKNVLYLLWNLAPRLIDECYILPGIQLLRNHLKIVDEINESHAFKLLTSLFDEISIAEDGHIAGYAFFGNATHGKKRIENLDDFIFLYHRLYPSKSTAENKLSTELYSNLKKKSSKEGFYYQIKLKSLKKPDPIYNFICHDTLFGVFFLKNIFDMEAELINKYKKTDIMLNDLLG